MCAYVTAIDTGKKIDNQSAGAVLITIVIGILTPTPPPCDMPKSYTNGLTDGVLVFCRMNGIMYWVRAADNRSPRAG